MSSVPATLTTRALFGDPALRSYLSNLRDWHGYIRFLGMPDRRDHPDIIVDRLFVRPLLARRYVSPDEEPKDWIDDAEPLLEALTSDKPMVLLGDPGTGKSVLVNYLIWMLARPSENDLVARTGWHLPVPMVLRELPLDGVTNFDGLLRAFLRHPMSEPLRNGTLLGDRLSSGKCLILLDGVDEIGDLATRRRLRQAVADGLARFPSCRWLLTSRIVGYDEVPFDPNTIDRGGRQPVNGSEQHLDPFTAGTFSDVVVRYIAPFDDPRIGDFARRWYEYRRHASLRSERAAVDFFVAVHADDAILRLGRIPHLLTIMALIHRIEATLPQERALLYDRIAEAYLESIDKFRGIYSGAADLPFKKRWLARVGFEMQRRRDTHRTAGRSDILVDGADVLSWVRDEMQRNPGGEIDNPEQFIQFVKRRSGLLVPRGENHFAFIHLSFQEYFAAHALKREVTTPTWIRKGTSSLGFKRKSLAEWARSATWTETLVFLFDMLSADEDWYDDLRALIFDDDFSYLCNSDSSAYELNTLLSRLTSSSRSRFSVSDVLDTIRRRKDRSSIHTIDFGGLEISDLAPIADLTSLHTLSLDDTRISDFTPLAGLTSLHTLTLILAQAPDISPLAGLSSLRTLTLASTQMFDLSVLAGLSSVRRLTLVLTKMSDISPIADLKNIERLSLDGTLVSDLTPVSALKSLQTLVLQQTPVSDLGPLSGLTAVLALSLDGTLVSDLTPVSALKSIQTLVLRRTPVSDLRPLSGLCSLRALTLDGTPVSCLGSLADLTSLERLDIGANQVPASAVSELRDALPNCKITTLGEVTEPAGSP